MYIMKLIRKKGMLLLMIYVATAFAIGSCSPVGASTNYMRHQSGFFHTFDTFVRVIIYTETHDELDVHFEIVREAFEHYHKLFDIYNIYDGINNLATVNNYAGVRPVQVDRGIIDLLNFSKQAYFETGGMLNVTLGPVLSIWHEYRMYGIANPQNAALPDYAMLRTAASLADINGLIIDEQQGTVFLTQVGMSLDVGATAKAFTAARAIELLRERGVVSAIVDAGGDIATIGSALTNGGRPWSVGVRNPIKGGVLDSVRVWDLAAATSGSAHRAYVVDGVYYNHIIDPATLMPATNFASVTVVHEEAEVTEMLSTALFILPIDEGFDLAERFGAAVIWVFHDGSVEFNERYREMSANFN